MTQPTPAQVPASPLLAFEVEIHSLTCVVFAATPAKARWIAVRSYWEAGYGRGSGTWPRPKATRAPAFDNCQLKDRGGRAWVPEYIRELS